MFRRLLIIDVLLIAFLVYGGTRIRQEWFAFWTTHRVQDIRAAAETVAAPPAPAVPAAANFAEWTEIAARNPFSFDRNDAPIIIVPPAAAPVGPKPILFGTMSLGNETFAMMGQPGNRNARAVHIGESIDGWELVETQDKSVTVRSGERRETVLMNDPTAQVPRDSTRTAAGNGASVVQATPAPPQGNEGRPTAAPDSGVRPPPVNASGQPQKGHWIKTPFGDKFLED